MVLSETLGLQLFWDVRGGIELNQRLSLLQAHSPNSREILALEPERFESRRRPQTMTPNFNPALVTRLSGLVFQMFWIETFSFLPDR